MRGDETEEEERGQKRRTGMGCGGNAERKEGTVMRGSDEKGREEEEKEDEGRRRVEK